MSELRTPEVEDLLQVFATLDDKDVIFSLLEGPVHHPRDQGDVAAACRGAPAGRRQVVRGHRGAYGRLSHHYRPRFEVPLLRHRRLQRRFERARRRKEIGRCRMRRPLSCVPRRAKCGHEGVSRRFVVSFEFCGIFAKKYLSHLALRTGREDGRRCVEAWYSDAKPLIDAGALRFRKGRRTGGAGAARCKEVFRMTNSARGIDRRTFVAGAAVVGAAALLRPVRAWAEPTSAEKFAEADAVRGRITLHAGGACRAAEDYYKALDEHEAPCRPSRTPSSV